MWKVLYEASNLGIEWYGLSSVVGAFRLSCSAAFSCSARLRVLLLKAAGWRPWIWRRAILLGSAGEIKVLFTLLVH